MCLSKLCLASASTPGSMRPRIKHAGGRRRSEPKLSKGKVGGMERRWQVVGNEMQRYADVELGSVGWSELVAVGW